MLAIRSCARIGASRAPEEFFASFGQRVTNIGHMLSLMTPWDDPKYITRVWCCFEMCGDFDIILIIPRGCLCSMHATPHAPRVMLIGC